MVQLPALAGLTGLALATLTACNDTGAAAEAPGASAPLAVATTAQTASSVDASDRAAIEAIIKDYLINNPEVLQEALVAVEEKERMDLANSLASDSRDFTIGPDDAKVTIIEYFDYRCGYCKRSVDWLLDTAKDNPDTVRVVFKEMPILSAESQDAALAALAAGEQGKYLEMHQALMEAPGSRFSEEDIDEIAREIGINATKMRRDMRSAEIRQHLIDTVTQAREAGVSSTPTFFVNGTMVAGADIDQLNELIQDAKES